MKSKTIILTALAGFLLSGCAAYEKKNQSGAAVDVNGHYLYRSTLDSLTLGMSSEDSLRFVQQYVSQWAKDILMYDKAKVRTNSAIDALVEDYRRTLYVHAYEQYLVDYRMPKAVPDSTVQQVYDQMPDRFLLDESIVKGILVVVPNDAPHIAKLRGWMAKVELDNIEKYAYQNASGYELFVDRWLTVTDLEYAPQQGPDRSFRFHQDLPLADHGETPARSEDAARLRTAGDRENHFERTASGVLAKRTRKAV